MHEGRAGTPRVAEESLVMVEAWYLSLAPGPLGEQHSIDVLRRIQPERHGLGEGRLQHGVAAADDTCIPPKVNCGAVGYQNGRGLPVTVGLPQMVQRADGHHPLMRSRCAEQSPCKSWDQADPGTAQVTNVNDAAILKVPVSSACAHQLKALRYGGREEYRVLQGVCRVGRKL